MAPEVHDRHDEPLDSLRLYLRQAREPALLTAEEELALAVQLRRGDRARQTIIGQATRLLVEHVAEPRVARQLTKLREELTPEFLEQVEAATGLKLGRRQMTDSDLLRKAAFIASEKVRLRNRQTIDVETQEAIQGLLGIARFVEDTLVPLAGRIVAKTPVAEKWGEREKVVADGEAARRQLREANLSLVIHVARFGPRRWKRMAMADRIQEGNVGLLQAVDGYDPARFRTRFSTYAVPIIWNSINRAVMNQYGFIRQPIYVQEAIARFRRSLRILEAKTGRQFTVEDALVELDLLPADCRAITRGLRNGRPVSLFDREDEENGLAMTSSHPAEEVPERLGNVERVETFRARIRQLLGVLTKHEAEVVSLRLGLHDSEPRTQGELGQQLGITRGGVQMAEASAIRKLEAAVLNGHRNGNGKPAPAARNQKDCRTHGGYAQLFERLERMRVGYLSTEYTAKPES